MGKANDKGEASETPGDLWDRVEAMPGWVVCREPKDTTQFSKSGLQIVAETNMRPTKLVVLAVGPPRPLPGGLPGHPVALKKGDTILVPEYGVKVHEYPPHGNLRCYEHGQVLARIDPEPEPEKPK